MEFYQPTKTHKLMLVLEHIHQNDKVTQKELARLTHASVAMINQYIDELDDNNYITRKYISAKVIRYYVTDKGYKFANYLKLTFIKESMDLYVYGQTLVSHFLESVVKKSFDSVILYGGGEVAEIFVDMISKNNIELEVKAIIDDDLRKIGKNVRDVEIIPLNKVDSIEHDGIIITSYRYEKEITQIAIATCPFFQNKSLSHL